MTGSTASCSRRNGQDVKVYKRPCARLKGWRRNDADSHSAVQSQSSDGCAARRTARSGRSRRSTKYIRTSSAAESGKRRRVLRRCSTVLRARRQKGHEATIQDLHVKIGELTVERQFVTHAREQSARATEDDRTRPPESECEPGIPTVRCEQVNAVLPTERQERGDTAVTGVGVECLIRSGTCDTRATNEGGQTENHSCLNFRKSLPSGVSVRTGVGRPST